jgi:hypothetical protein
MSSINKDDYMFWDLKEAKDKKHKYVIVFKNINKKDKNYGTFKKISFGGYGYNDYIIYNDTTGEEEADKYKRAYIKRHQKNEDWTDPFAKGTLSRFILWNKRNLIDSLIDYVGHFNIK